MKSSLILAVLATLASATPTDSSAQAKWIPPSALANAAPIFGPAALINSTSPKSKWMKHIADNTPLTHMNIPGTHDSATWNYTQSTQDALSRISALDDVYVPPAIVFRCQGLSMVEMLNHGIRAFDLRVAQDPFNKTLVFHHSSALLSERATLEDVLHGFYRWLDCHPSETVFLSIQYETGTAKYATFNAHVQKKFYNAVTSPEARKYILQTKNKLGTLGEARGKVNLLRRFDLDQLPASHTDALPGLHFSPSKWTVDGPDFRIMYNTRDNLTAYIEDYYDILTPKGSSAAENIQWKFNATVRHLKMAAEKKHQDDLFWSFASSENDLNTPIDVPAIMALGNGTVTPEGGVNAKLTKWFKGQKGKKMGIVMFDFFERPGDLIDTFLSM
ncbi:uncharacterized protein N7459_004216 [Penicillium hispanicum]|uniref:uncharacterized protein n=1 Tax=Penicillium hispanicum TaxID=1080232 RepID=UPI0025407E3A|nr:uncharacterized protein N7459_004216 [Penicillium hispanicum]KAJ5584416.1 hypothetical protein N7459_004216 [Penicillium hispanicum]